MSLQVRFPTRHLPILYHANLLRCVLENSLNGVFKRLGRQIQQVVPKLRPLLPLASQQDRSKGQLAQRTIITTSDNFFGLFQPVIVLDILDRPHITRLLPHFIQHLPLTRPEILDQQQLIPSLVFALDRPDDGDGDRIQRRGHPLDLAAINQHGLLLVPEELEEPAPDPHLEEDIAHDRGPLEPVLLLGHQVVADVVLDAEHGPQLHEPVRQLVQPELGREVPLTLAATAASMNRYWRCIPVIEIALTTTSIPVNASTSPAGG